MSNLLRRILRDEKSRYIAANLIWVWLGLAAALAAIAFFVNPASLAASPIGHVLHPYDYIWNGGFLVSGLMLVVAILFRRPDLEAFGLMAFAGSVLVYTLALIVVGAAAIGVFTYPALVIAALSRVMFLVTASQMVAALKDGSESKIPPTGGALLALGAPLVLLPFAVAGLDVAGIAALVAVVFGTGGVAAYRLIRPQRIELTARAADSISEAADRIIRRQQEQMEHQASEIRTLRSKIDALDAKIIHQQETDMALASVRAERDAAQAAVARLDRRVNSLIELMSKNGLPVPASESPSRPRS
jgi:hypothetical membrane protein